MLFVKFMLEILKKEYIYFSNQETDCYVRDLQMKGVGKSLRNGVFVFMLVLILYGSICQAEGTATIMEANTGETDIAIYVKNAGSDLSGITVQIGTSESSRITCQSIEDSEFETLILIDNSLSIPQNARGRISDFLQNFINAKAGNEKIAIGVFSREITYLTGYTSDYNTLINAVEAITYQNQETYITDMLYELLSREYVTAPKDVYRRIIIIADGIDNESIGYTTDELNQLMKENTYPIYTIGCKTSKNNEELEKLFALSRLSGAGYFLLDSAEEISSIVSVLSEDKQIVKIVATPPADMMDGSRKSVKVNIQGQSVSIEMKMPQQVKQQEISESPESTEEITEETQEETVEESSVEETTIQENEDDLHRASALKFIVFVIVFWVIVAIAIIVFILIRHFKKKRQMEIKKTQILMTQRELELKEALADGHAIPLSGQQHPIAYIILTDIHSPGRSFRVPFNRDVVIGRSKTACQIVLDYDQSVSGRHCEIYTMGSKLMIKDLQSSNGTFINGNRIFSDTELVSGNIITLGRLEMRFEFQQMNYDRM